MLNAAALLEKLPVLCNVTEQAPSQFSGLMCHMHFFFPSCHPGIVQL